MAVVLLENRHGTHYAVRQPYNVNPGPTERVGPNHMIEPILLGLLLLAVYSYFI